MTDLYMGRLMAGSPRSAAAALGVTGSNSGSSSSSNCSNTVRAAVLPSKQHLLSASVQLEEVGQQQDQMEVLSQPEPAAVQQQRVGNTKDVSVQAAETDVQVQLMPTPQQLQAACQVMSTAQQSDTAPCSQLAPAGELATAVAASDSAVSPRTFTNTQQKHSGCPQREDHLQQQQHHLHHHLVGQQVGRTSARAGHPIAAGYGVTAQPTHDTSSARLSCSPHRSQPVTSAPASCCTAAQQEDFSPRPCDKQADGKGAFAILTSRLSGGGRPEQNSPRALASGKWAEKAGGFLGFQSNNSAVVGSGRFIPRGWVQFSSKATADDASSTPGGDAVDDSLSTGGGPALQQSERGFVESFVEPGTPSKAAVSTTAAAAVASTPLADPAADGAQVNSGSGFDGDDADWSRPAGQCCGNINKTAAVHCTAMSASAATVS